MGFINENGQRKMPKGELGVVKKETIRKIKEETKEIDKEIKEKIYNDAIEQIKNSKIQKITNYINNEIHMRHKNEDGDEEEIIQKLKEEMSQIITSKIEKIVRKKPKDQDKNIIELSLRDLLEDNLKTNEKIKLIRLTQGKCQKDFAKELSISEYTYKNYEEGHSPIPIDILISIANMGKVSTDYLCGLKKRNTTEYDYNITAEDIKFYTGLDISTILQLNQEKNALNTIILNYLFIHNVIYDLINLIKNNLQYINIYSFINKSKEDIAQSVDNLAEYIKWKNTEFINEKLIDITKDLSQYIPDEDYLKKLSEIQKAEYSEGEKIINMITKNINYFSELDKKETK